jgi:hypothetical protein
LFPGGGKVYSFFFSTDGEKLWDQNIPKPPI